MRGREVPKPSVLGRISVFSFTLSILILTCAASAFAQGQRLAPVPAPPVASPSAEILHSWRRGMTQVPLPKPGCFTSTYPNTGWREVPPV
jgi:energy-converting hydrogenase Eha subunit F